MGVVGGLSNPSIWQQIHPLANFLLDWPELGRRSPASGGWRCGAWFASQLASEERKQPLRHLLRRSEVHVVALIRQNDDLRARKAPALVVRMPCRHEPVARAPDHKRRAVKTA